LALASCILSDWKALCPVEEFYEGKDIESLFEAGIVARDFNDDVLGTSFDKLFDAGRNRACGNAISLALEAHDVVMDLIHFDMTSLSVCGEYRN